jgi:hypothetical protein
MDFLNVASYATSSSSTKVLVLDGNTVKSRTASQVVTDGGGGGSTARTFQTTIFGADGGGSSESISADDADNGYGWPYDGIGDQADSLLRTYKFAIPFNPTSYRFTAVCVTAASDGGASSGVFGVKFQWSTDNSTWSTGGVDHDIDTLNFRGKTIGDFASTNGNMSISGSPSLVYIRCVQVNTLNNNNDASISVRAFIANFWN